MKEQPRVKATHVSVKIETYELLKQIAAEEGRTLRSVIERALKKYKDEK